MNASAFNAVPKSLPHGVVGLLGWANRVLIVATAPGQSSRPGRRPNAGVRYEFPARRPGFEPGPRDLGAAGWTAELSILRAGVSGVAAFLPAYGRGDAFGCLARSEIECS